MVLHNKTDKRVLKEWLANDEVQRITLSFYCYAKLGNPEFFRNHLYTELSDLDVMGRIYVAQEGVNAQISVPKENLEKFRDKLNTISFLEDIRLNIAIDDDGKSFYKLKIKVREKIVADGLNDDTFDVTNKGTHVDAKTFNALADDPNTIIVDMRNHYESEVGHFVNAFKPDADTFRDALVMAEDHLNEQKDKNLLMYCTGGIRCEKASAYYKHKGFENVYQLDGGIIEYARQVDNDGLENKFIGKNFVFDERLGERISEDVIAHCHQCGAPCDVHINCRNIACNLLFIQCDNCAEKYEHCCSDACKEVANLPEEEQRALRKGKQTPRNVFRKGRFEWKTSAVQ